MMKVFIADDEVNVRQGLKKIINWEELGFQICGEAGNGVACLEGIISKKPDLVLLDIRMPKMQGIQVVKSAREQGFTGKIIILSGYSDFEYAQSAIRYNVDYYLLKPIDEEELTNAVKSVYNTIMEEKKEEASLNKYFLKAKNIVLRDIITGSVEEEGLNEEEISYLKNQLGLEYDCYKLILVERYYNDRETPFHENDLIQFFHLIHSDIKYINFLEINNQNILLLKGSQMINRFEKLLTSLEKEEVQEHYKPYVIVGKTVTSIIDISESYHNLNQLRNQKFFSNRNKSILLEDNSKEEKSTDYLLTKEEGDRIYELLYKNIESYNRTGIKEVLEETRKKLEYTSENIESIKNFLTGILLHIKHDVSNDYKKSEIEFKSNAEMISTIQKMNFLYEVLDYLEDQMVQIIKAIGNSTCESILSDILHYIDQNYKKNLKLETIATIFGYNSAYLGKVFTKNMGENFNSYVDKVRINYAKELVLEDKLKIYEIAENVGYKNLDYFHRKFKRYVGYSPAEYRKMVKENSFIEGK